jgi:hypothetical protein
MVRPLCASWHSILKCIEVLTGLNTFLLPLTALLCSAPTLSRFKEIDREGYGKINLNQLSDFLRQYEIPCTTEAVRALFVAMNRSGNGILLADFEHWVKGEGVEALGVVRVLY